MEILLYQIIIAFAIVLIGTFGTKARNLITLLACIFTIVMIFTLSLAILQFITIFIAYYISSSIRINQDNSKKNKKFETESISRKHTNPQSLIYIFIIIIIGIIFNHSLKDKNVKNHSLQKTESTTINNTKNENLEIAHEVIPSKYYQESSDSVSTKNIRYISLNDYNTDDEIEDPNNESLKNESLLKNKYSYIREFENRYPSDVGLFEEGFLRHQMVKLLGDKYFELFLKNTMVQSRIKTNNDGLIFISGGAPHSFTFDEACIEIDLLHNEITIAILDNRKIIYCFTEKEEINLNLASDELKLWINKANKNIKN